LATSALFSSSPKKLKPNHSNRVSEKSGQAQPDPVAVAARLKVQPEKRDVSSQSFGNRRTPCILSADSVTVGQ
jgi:hypothetical protein